MYTAIHIFEVGKILMFLKELSYRLTTWLHLFNQKYTANNKILKYHNLLQLL